MCNMEQFSPEALVYTASTLAIAISKNLSDDEIDILSGFFSALGDNLALIASARPQCPESD